MSRSKNSYEIRAMSFLKQFAKYVDNWESVKRVNYAVNMFNMKRHRKVEFLSGATRLCVVTSDYVIKWDRRGDSKYNDCEIFGGCRDAEIVDEPDFFGIIDHATGDWAKVIMSC